jgi:anti-sigma regulatory factor (Ser/Thr protein kinase)
MDEPLEIRREARLENLRSLREFAVNACLSCGGDQDTCDVLELAVDEACTNVVLHGYADREPGPIVLTFRCEGGDAVVIIADHGQPFSPADAPSPDLESDWQERRIGGLGVYLIREMMDEVTYTSDPQAGNRLTLRKRMHP